MTCDVSWQDEHFPDNLFEEAPAHPSELADHLSPDARKALVAEAAAHYRANDNWVRRRRSFLWLLNLYERVGFP